MKVQRHRSARLTNAPVALLVALCGALLVLFPGHLLAHAIFPTVQDISPRPAMGPGNWAMTATFGLLFGKGAGKQIDWVCEAAYTSDSQGLDASIVALSDDSMWVTSDGKGFSSVDGGCSWQPFFGTTGATYVHGVHRQAGGGGLWLSAVVGTTGQTSQIWHRDTKTGTWSERYKSNEVQLRELYLAASNPDHAVAIGPLHADPKTHLVIRTENAGKTWHQHVVKGPPGTLFLLPMHPSDPKLLLLLSVAEIDGIDIQSIWRSDDGGENFSQVFKLKPLLDIQDAVWLPDAPTPVLLVGGLTAGLWRSTDAGLAFEKIEKPSKEAADIPEIGCLRYLEGKVFACTNNDVDHCAIMSSEDHGQTWKCAFCFNAIDGPLQCATAGGPDKICVEPWAKLSKDKIPSHGKPCDDEPGNPRTGDAGGSGPTPADAGGTGDIDGGVSADVDDNDAAPGETDAADLDADSGSAGPVEPGCGCSTTTAEDTTPPWTLMLMAMAVIVARRHRRSRL